MATTRRGLGTAALAAAAARVSTPMPAPVSTPMPMPMPAAGAMAATPQAGGLPGWDVPARWISPPATISDRMRPTVAAPPDAFWQSRPSRAAIAAARALGEEALGRPAPELWRLLDVDAREETVGGVRCYRMTPAGADPAASGRLLIHLHGGAFLFDGGVSGSNHAAFLAHAAGIPALSVDYRMAPAHPHPAALEDALAVWTAETASRAPGRVGLVGTSAGGALAMSLVQALAAARRPGPGAACLGSPWADLGTAGDSCLVNELVDNLVVTCDGVLEIAARLYAAGADLRDPAVSPIYGDLSCFPPTLLLSGTRDLLLSCTVRAHVAMLAANVAADLLLFEGLSHGQWLPWADPLATARDPAPETAFALSRIARFFAAALAG